MICLVCEKTIEMADPDSTTNPIGGTLEADFGYGSRFDQMRGWNGRKSHFLDNSGYYRREEILALGRCVYITPNET